MASFDITRAAGIGYSTIWQERHYLARLAAVPFLIKLVCFSAVLELGWEANPIRLALVMLPSYFADGWMLSHLVRLILLDQRWPFQPTGNTGQDMQMLQDRALGVMKGTLTFAVSRFLLGAVMAFVMEISERGLADVESESVNFGLFFLALLSFVFLFWAFRLLWLYIPAAVNYGLSAFMRKLGGFSSSLHLVGAWLMCFVPLFLGFGMLLSLISGMIDGGAGGSTMLFLANVLRILLDTIVNILATIAMAIGFRQIMSAPESKGGWPGPDK